jgi:hypothetical protein
MDGKKHGLLDSRSRRRRRRRRIIPFGVLFRQVVGGLVCACACASFARMGCASHVCFVLGDFLYCFFSLSRSFVCLSSSQDLVPFTSVEMPPSLAGRSGEMPPSRIRIGLASQT